MTNTLGDPMEINHMDESHLLHLYTFRSIHNTSSSLYMNVCRAPGGQVGFMNKAATLFTLFKGPVFIFHRELQAFAEAPSNVFVNFPIQAVLDVLRIGGVSDLEKSRMAACIGSPVHGPRREMPRWSAARTRLFREDDFEGLTGMDMELNDAGFAPRTVVIAEEDVEVENTGARDLGQLIPVLTDHDELAAAIRLSEEEYARSIAAQKPLQAKRDWQSILKPVEKALPGQPQCNVCFENRASICIVACGHQCICDDCIKQLVKHTCIVCRAEFDQIVRPLASLVAPVLSQRESTPIEPPLKRQRRKAKGAKV